MKTMKRAALLLLAAVLLAALAVPALAADPPTKGTITIQKSLDENNVSTGSFTLYRLFDATIAFDAEGNAGGIVYTCTDAQKVVDGFDTYFTAGTGNQVTVKDAAVAADGTLSQAAVDWIKANITALGTKVNPFWRQQTDTPWYENVTEGGKSYYKVHNLPFGYYYVDSSVGSVVMIDSTHPDAAIVDKNDVPSFKKEITQLTNADEVEHNGDIQTGNDENVVYNGYWYSNYGDNHAATVQIGDTVTYTLTVVARKGAENYRVSDWQSLGLTLDPDSIEIKANGQTLSDDNYTLYTAPNPQMLIAVAGSKDGVTGLYPYPLYRGGNPGYYPRTYTYNPGVDPELGALYTSESQTDYMFGNMFVLFDQDYLDTITTDTTITITYDCVVNKNLEVASFFPGSYNDNMAFLLYGHSGRLEDRCGVFSARIIVYKYEGDGSSVDSGKPLSGVKFVLKNIDGKYLHQDETTRAITWVDNLAGATEFETGGNQDTTTGRYYQWYFSDDNLNPGPDGETGTADDYYYATDYYGVPYIGRPGPDGVFGTGDDIFVHFTPGAATTYTAGPDGEWGTGDETATIGDGVVWIDGLTNGTYTLVETYALPGYSLAEDISLTIDNNTPSDSSNNLAPRNSFARLKVQTDVANKTGSLLPHTGGIGVTIFYVAGTVLILGAGYLLLRKRRTEN